MANLLYGKVFFHNHFTGILSEEPGNASSFSYDSSYLNTNLPPIAHSLPLQSTKFSHPSGLLPFFDNLVAEGWLKTAQTKLLGKRQASRLELLLAFGHDCAGAVSIQDPSPTTRSQDLINPNDPLDLAVLSSHASLSGIQPKLAITQHNNKFYPSKNSELSTHIAKFPSKHHDDLIQNEFLSTLAFKTLLPDDKTVDLHIGPIEGLQQNALIIKRFDRHNNQPSHFEEFTQLLNIPSTNKYNGSYKDMANFIQNNNSTLPSETYTLFLRIITGLLLGNTDMHLKNFAMLHTPQGLRLTPSYDIVSSILYDYKSLALAIANTPNLHLPTLKPTLIIKLAQEFSLSNNSLLMATQYLKKNLPNAINTISNAPINNPLLKNKLIKQIQKRWNQSFNSIGKNSSKKP